MYCGVWITVMQRINSGQESIIILASKDPECLGVVAGLLI